MPLIDHPTLKNRKIPDENGGWYWLSLQKGAWEPVEVQPANESGWPQGINLHSHWVDAADINGEWGPQITKEDAEKLAAIKDLLEKIDLDAKDDKLQEELQKQGRYTEQYHLLARASIREKIINQIKAIVS